MRLFTNLRRGLALLYFVIGFGAGCNPTAPAPAVKSSRPISLISPLEFFPPDQKRLAAHLNWHVGCFNFDYAGPTTQLTSRLETWTQGRPEPRGGVSTNMEAGTGEISISVQEWNVGPNYQVKLVQSSGSGHMANGGSYARPKWGGWSTQIAKIQNPTELKLGEEIPVWALCLFKSGTDKRTGNSSETVFDQIKKSDWALVLKVGLNPAN